MVNVAFTAVHQKNVNEMRLVWPPSKRISKIFPETMGIVLYSIRNYVYSYVVTGMKHRTKEKKMIRTELVNKTTGKVIKVKFFSREHLLQVFWDRLMDHNQKRYNRGLSDRLILLVDWS